MDVARIFNVMAANYDSINDLWYAWLFSRIHFIITKQVIRRFRPARVLDVGSGTGFQSFLHAAAGEEVVGVDIAEELVRVADRKARGIGRGTGLPLFSPNFDFVEHYNRMIDGMLADLPNRGKYISPSFVLADATKLPFNGGLFDHVNCCGSTLSFIDDYEEALRQMERMMKDSGTILMEVESRWNLDIIWPLLDLILRGRLGYDMKPHEALRGITSPFDEHISVEYPFGSPHDPIFMNIRLFSRSRLLKELDSIGLVVLKTWTIHSVTNLMPSTYLDMSNPPEGLKTLFQIMTKVEERLPFSLPGCSLVILAKKRATGKSR